MIPCYYRIIEIQYQLVGSNPASTNYCSFPLGVRVGGVLLYTWITESQEQAFELSELDFTFNFASFLCNCFKQFPG